MTVKNNIINNEAYNNLDPAIRCLPTISQFKKTADKTKKETSLWN